MPPHSVAPESGLQHSSQLSAASLHAGAAAVEAASSITGTTAPAAGKLKTAIVAPKPAEGGESVSKLIGCASSGNQCLALATCFSRESVMGSRSPLRAGQGSRQLQKRLPHAPHAPHLKRKRCSPLDDSSQCVFPMVRVSAPPRNSQGPLQRSGGASCAAASASSALRPKRYTGTTTPASGWGLAGALRPSALTLAPQPSPGLYR